MIVSYVFVGISWIERLSMTLILWLLLRLITRN